MARINGRANTNGFEPPPSSMLATHVRPGAVVPHLNKQNFAQLLEESLGHDESDRPNLGDDPGSNHKLVIIVVTVGIDPILDAERDNPFRSRQPPGRDTSQLQQCLEVLHLAVTRTRGLLYRVSIDNDAVQPQLPLYSHLLPKLLSVAARSQDIEISRQVFRVIDAGLQTEKTANANCSFALKRFIYACLSGLVAAVVQHRLQPLAGEVTFTENAFTSPGMVSLQGFNDIGNHFSISTFQQLLFVTCQLITFLSQHETGKVEVMHLKKQTLQLETVINELESSSESSTTIQNLKVEIEGLSLNQNFHTQSFDSMEDIQEWADSDRARKRPRLSTKQDYEPSSLTKIQEIAADLTLLLTGHQATDFLGLNKTIVTKFEAQSKEQQRTSLERLGLAACRMYTLNNETDIACPICDDAPPPKQSCHNELDLHLNELLSSLLAIKATVQRHQRLRLPALNALRRLVSHAHSVELFKLKGTPAGEWCLQAMRFPSRELKVGGSRAIQAFVRGGHQRDKSALHDNRVASLEFLQALWKEGKAANQEAIVLALSGMARVAEDEDMNIILLRLFDYLGHKSGFVSALVYGEIQQLAQYLSTNPANLFRPFWRTLSVIIVQNITSRPVIAQQVSDLMGMQVDGLLQTIEEYALPYLVLNRDQNTILRICKLSDQSITPFDLCTKQNNFPRILALLMTQGFSDPETTISGYLANVSEDFRDQDLAGWLALFLTETACEVLKSIADAGRGKPPKAYGGMQLLAQLQSRRTGLSMTPSKRAEATSSFLERNALAIVTHFTARLNESSVRETIADKRRYLVALGEFIRLGQGRVSVALPHVCACLRAAMDEKALCDTAFSTWSDVLGSIDEDEIRELIGQTFAIIIRIWPDLSSIMQDTAYNLVDSLLREHETLIRDVYSSLPSLASIPIMSKFEIYLNKLKKQRDERNQLAAFLERLGDGNMIVVEQALYELSAVLRDKNELIQKSVLREPPDGLIAELIRAMLDVCVKFKSSNRLLMYAGQCLGAVGCVDPSKIESIRDKKTYIVLNNFGKADETIGFLMFLIERILVKEYVSSSNVREKGFLAFSLQQLLQVCDFPPDITSRSKVGGLNDKERKWFELSDTARLVLTPFLTSRFFSAAKGPRKNIQYPYFKPGMTYKAWLTEVTLDFLNRGSGDNVDIIFDICGRLVAQGRSTSVASFLLPYVALNLLLTGTEKDKECLLGEMTWVLEQNLINLDSQTQEHIQQCSQSVFDILDYMSVWLQETRKQSALTKARAERGIRDLTLDTILGQTTTVEKLMSAIPPQILTQKALDCRSYARALFHQEQYVMSQAEPTDADFRRLQDIYEQIDEPDGIEGFSSQMKFLDVECEVMEHKKAGRWHAAQSWYEMQLTGLPDSADAQVNLMKCLKESGQHEVLIHHFDSITDRRNHVNTNLLHFAIEAAWVTQKWDKLADYLTESPRNDFTTSLGKVMMALRANEAVTANTIVDQIFQSGAMDFTPNSTVSFQESHEARLKLHILEDIRIMIAFRAQENRSETQNFEKRLDILGSNVADKQYLLGIQRAIMHLTPSLYQDGDLAASWMTSARLARKAQATHQAFNSLLRASAFGDRSATMEQAKLMWQEGDHRKAIQTLEGAINTGTFGPHIQRSDTDAMVVDKPVQEERNDMTARAYVLLGKWLDQAGQTQSEVIIKTFRKSTEQNRRFEKGWYNLGRHYNKILESEKLKPPGKESQPFLTGEAAKLVIDNFLRALVSGNKYMFQTLPKVLTLWLELVGTELEHDARRGNNQFHQHNKIQRKKVVEDTNATVKKYLDQIQPYALYTILPQLVARICHADQSVNNLLQLMILKVIKAFPQQALWTVLATVKSASQDRVNQGKALIRKCAENAKKDMKIFSASEMRDFINASQKFSDELLRIADFKIEGRVTQVSLAKDFGFNHKIAPSKLVVPSEACLIPNIPSNNDMKANKSFRAFAKEPVTISAFLDSAKVLPSLQKPRKLSLRGSDGKIYSVLAKPHDDLRKDQRLMEFNTMINRFLKHDIEAAKRRLYIKTYAVIPLNEECGLIEWVDGLATMRDILLRLYRQRGILPDYAAVGDALNKICARSEDKAKDFIDQVQSRFPPVLRQWFVENFPDPTAWFNARLRYTRTSAVMSMVGHVLGLGDRHGENILLEEGSGGILHVDFNCLFDKGLTFEKPECVPFRLTHNMQNAMGSYKYEGPFRRCCEITTNLLRNNEDALIPILETFLHDPTTDFQTAGKKRKPTAGYGAGGYAAAVEVPDTPESMLEGVKGKVRGMLPGESVPLSVGGYVDYMIRQAKDEANLVRMYIGWCAFF